MKDQFSEIARRTRRWKFEDGITELTLGGILFLSAMYFLLQLIPALSPTLIFSILTLGFIVTLFVPNLLKKRYVYPRSGYVKYTETTPKGVWKPLLLGALAGILMAALLYLVLIYDHDHAFSWITTLVAVFIGLVWLIGNTYYRIPRLSFLGLFSMVVGVILSPLVLGSEFTRGEFIGGILLATYFLLMAVFLFISGGLAFRAFLRSNPLPKESPDEQ